MKEKRYNILKKALQNLPDYAFDSDQIWKNIDDSLHEKQFFINKEYPEYDLPKDIWPEINKALDVNRTKKVYFSIVRVAASIAILISIGLVFNKQFSNKSKNSYYIYSSEIIDNQNELNEELPIGTTGVDRIRIICANNPDACSTPLLKELSRQIDDISAEMKNLSEKFNENKDPQILRYYYLLENQKVEIELQMIKIINQS
jgi:hypothetical protein